MFVLLYACILALAQLVVGIRAYEVGSRFADAIEPHVLISVYSKKFQTFQLIVRHDTVPLSIPHAVTRLVLFQGSMFFYKFIV